VIVKHLTGTKAGRALLLLLVLALLAVALQSLVFSSAGYTAGSASPTNHFRAGTLAHTNSMAGQVALDASGLRPGQSKAGTFSITGGGDLSGAYTLSRASLVDTPAAPALSATLTLIIQDVTSGVTTIYDGRAAAFGSRSLGLIAPGATRVFRLTLTYPAAAADPALQGATMLLRLQITGVTP
jgi:hypothetical protein